jgi:hypothetical protein
MKLGSSGRWLAASALAGVLAGAAQPARAGNDDGILVGSEAALTGGAVTAVVSDGSAAWYNPAGLAQLRRPTFDINASTYGIRRVSTEDLFTLPDGTRSRAAFLDWQLVPSALSFARLFGPRVVGSFGIFIPTASDLDLRTTLREADGTRWSFGLDAYRNEYVYALGAALRASDTLRWGMTLQGVYISREDMVQAGMGVPGDSAAPFMASSSHRTTGDYGARVGLGVQWSPAPAFTLGLALQTPTLTGFRLVAADALTGSYGGASQPDAAGYETSHESALRAVWELSTPCVVRAGAAYKRGRSQWLVDGSLASRLNSREQGLDRRPVGNARLGWLFAVRDGLSAGLGLFSDLHGQRGQGVSYVGLAGGARFARSFSIDAAGRGLTFFTTLGGRYAYGRGYIAGVSFPRDDGAPVATRAGLRAHELALTLGGGVSY